MGKTYKDQRVDFSRKDVEGKKRKKHLQEKETKRFKKFHKHIKVDEFDPDDMD